MSLSRKEERETRNNVIRVEMWQRSCTCHTMLQMMTNGRNWCGHLWISGEGSGGVNVHITYWCHNTYKKQLLTAVGYLWNNGKIFRKASNSTYNTSLISIFKTPDLTSSSFCYQAVAAAEFRNTLSGSTHCVCLDPPIASVARAEHIGQADFTCLSLEHGRRAHLPRKCIGRNSEGRPNVPVRGHTCSLQKPAVVHRHDLYTICDWYVSTHHGTQ